MKISIITASYNYENYIKETIESILTQDYDDWEMIVVDDGSKDNSVEVIKQYCAKDKRIKLFQHENGENKGLSETLQLGLKKAQGEWVAFLESDDTYTFDCLSERLKIINKYEDVNFIFNDVNYFGEQSAVCEIMKYYPAKQRKYLDLFEFPCNLKKIFKKSNQVNIVPTFSVIMLKKELFKDIDWQSPLKPSLDFYLWLQIAAKPNCVGYFLDKKLSNWRMHKNSYISSNYDVSEHLRFRQKRIEFLYNGLMKYFQYILFGFLCLKYLRRSIIRTNTAEGTVCMFGHWLKIRK